MDASLIKSARDEASKPVKDTLASLAQAQAGHGEGARETTAPRLFFPNGIELLYGEKPVRTSTLTAMLTRAFVSAAS